jgi:hypothetical protein
MGVYSQVLGDEGRDVLLPNFGRNLNADHISHWGKLEHFFFLPMVRNKRDPSLGVVH